MWTYPVVFVDVCGNQPTQFSGRFVFMRIYLLCFEASEPSFNHDVVGPAPLPIHALPYPQFLEQGFVCIGGELAPLVGVENSRNAMSLDGFLDSDDY